jgi:hypothetical protein
MAHFDLLRHINGMPKVVSNQERELVLGALRGRDGLLSIDQVTQRLGGKLPRRTLQRRLAGLVESNRVIAIGNRGGRRYYIAGAFHEPFAVAEDAPNRPASHDFLPLSDEAVEIRRLVTRPLGARRPVGYNPSLLTHYRPNRTAYLSARIRQKLAAIGAVTGKPLPAGTYFRQVMTRVLVDLAWNSSRLEGNTYSLLETQRLLEWGESAVGKNARDAQMILNHRAAIEMLAERPEEIGFNRYTVCNLHALLADNLLQDSTAPGRLRIRAVGVSGSVFHPLEAPQLIEDYFDQILSKAESIRDPFEQALFLMVHLPYLQPFDDVNKRVSRLAANIPLMRRNVSPLSFVDVPVGDYLNGLLGVYELNRVDYLRDVFVWAYERSCGRYAAVRQSLGEPDPLRLKHRDLIGLLVSQVVRARLDKPTAARMIATAVASLFLKSATDRARLIEVVETELTSLHLGSIARYRLRPSEFHAWQRIWR